MAEFPSTNTTPPVHFYNFGGLAQWLNNNPSYKELFTGIFDNLVPVTSSLSTMGYDPSKVPLCSDVTTLSQQQALQYNQQIILFKKVYLYNSTMYSNYITNNVTPVYYTFATYQERTQYNSAVALINKLYNFQAMAERAEWRIPFPIFM
jgi:hypothetical protein